MEVARSACRNALKEFGHTPDYGDLETGDTFIHIQKQSCVKQLVYCEFECFYSYIHASDGDEELASPAFGLFFEDTPEKMSYTQQANKRYYCERLTWLVNFTNNTSS